MKEKDSEQEITYNKNIYEPAGYVYTLENSGYGGLINLYPVKIKDGENTILLTGFMYQK